MNATEELTGKVDVVSGDVEQLQRCETELRNSMMGLFESHRNLDNYITGHTVPREEYQQAMDEIKLLRSMMAELGQQVHQTKNELVHLHGTMQVLIIGIKDH